MKRKSWQLFAVFGLVGLLLAAVVSCGKPAVNSQANNTQEIEFWTMQLQPQFTEYFNKTIAGFEAENPGVKVRWVDVPWSAMESKILGAVSAKTAPDVVNLNPDFASLLAGRNAWLIWTLGCRSKFVTSISQISGKLVYSTARVLAFLGISRLG